MRRIDEQYLKTPFYGSRQMTRHLRREGFAVNRKRIQRLMRRMGLCAVYPRPRTTKPHPEHRIYPYLLRDQIIDRSHQVWCADVTFIPLQSGRPEIFNTDQGSQFTSVKFTDVLNEAGVRSSMDGRGRWLDNVFIERVWRSLKYECVYLNEFETGSEARRGIGSWFSFYNTQRPHSTHGGRTPDEVYLDSGGLFLLRAVALRRNSRRQPEENHRSPP